jgi:trigger factor
MQFAQFGMMSMPEEMLENYAKEMLKKKENVEGLVNRAIETKLAATLKAKVTLNNKEVSMEEFNDLLK